MQKKGFIALAVVALGSAAVLSVPLAAKEEGPRPEQKAPAFAGAGAGIEWLARELKLTNAQKEQLAAVHRDIEQQANDIRQDNLLAPAEKEVKMHALHEGLETRIKAVLTSDQIRKFDQMGGLKALMASVHGSEGFRPNLEAMFRELKLTDAQKAAVESVMHQQAPAFEAASGNPEKLAALKQAIHQKILALLTPDQRQKATAMMAAFEQERAAKVAAEQREAEEREHGGK